LVGELKRYAPEEELINSSIYLKVDKHYDDDEETVLQIRMANINK